MEDAAPPALPPTEPPAISQPAPIVRVDYATRAAALGHLVPARDALERADAERLMTEAMFAAGADRLGRQHATAALAAMERAGRHLRMIEHMVGGSA